ncbi:MAG: hypothetical protein JSR82_21495 [Verrucomicrobia bacterium]|nr:hypothetical protein [Verrucomicrobiota bacterium]
MNTPYRPGRPQAPTPRAFLEEAERLDDLAALVRGTITAGLYEPDLAFAEAYCRRLARHWNFNVRGNALQGLWHLLRRRGVAEPADLLEVIAEARRDESEYVRGQAEELAEALMEAGWG